MTQDPKIDDRKLNWFDWLKMYELLTSEQIALLDGGSKQKVYRNLHSLELAKPPYVIRPYGQRQSFHERRDPLAYGLANRGADSLAEKRGVPRSKLDWTKKNRVAKGNYKHKVLLNDLRIRLGVDTRARHDITYVWGAPLIAQFRTPVKTWSQSCPICRPLI